MLLLALFALACTTQSRGQFVIDGVADPAYDAPIAVQNTQTQFGDSSNGSVAYANGSEIDALYARIYDGVLYMVIAGNLESNFSKLDIFIDGVSGGQNQLRGDNPDVDFNGLNRMGDDPWSVNVIEGLTFDAAFAPDLWVSLTCGGTPFAVYMNQAQLLTTGGGTGGYVGSGGAGAAGAAIFKSGFGVGIDNSNIAGVPGGTDIDAGSGASVRTGVEVRVPLAAIPGYSSGEIKVMAFINGGGHDYASNQFIPGLGGGPNLAEPRLVRLDLIPGEQFVAVEQLCTGDGAADDDNDGVQNCADGCPQDPQKSDPGACGCGAPENDLDGDRIPDCIDNCTALWNPTQADCDLDGLGDVCELAAGSTDINGNDIPDSCECAADLFVDGQVNGADLGIALAQWGLGQGSVADIDRDGIVNGADLAIVLSSWGVCQP
jgi:hypothetical protein